MKKTALTLLLSIVGASSAFAATGDTSDGRVTFSGFVPDLYQMEASLSLVLAAVLMQLILKVHCKSSKVVNLLPFHQ